MPEKHYESKIELDKGGLHVRFAYERVFTEEEHENLLTHYQHRFSQRVGRPVPREEIRADPKDGDFIKEETAFLVRPHDTELYIGLHEIHERAPYAFPLLIKDLRRYKAKRFLKKSRRYLIDFAIGELGKISEVA